MPTRLLLALAVCLALLPPARAAAPNILFILADDLGVDAVGAFGSPDARTPNIDRLAAEGTRFTRHYVDSSCAATRVGLLTGAAPAYSGFRPAGLGISPERETYADALRQLGYATWHVGKWHAGFASRLAWPRQQGFDAFYGALNQFLLRAPGRAPDWRLRRPTYRDPWLQRDNAPPLPVAGDLTEALVDEAIARIQGAPAGRPWLLDLWTFAPHTPHQAPAAISAGYPDTPRGRYLAMVEVLDRAVGRILSALEQSGAARRTLVLFAGDNGTDPRFLPPAPRLPGGKGSLREGGLRTPLIVRWPGRVPAGASDDRIVAYTDYRAALVGAGGGRPRGFDFLGTGASRAAPLFWEYGRGDRRRWSALSADGSWRVVHDFPGATERIALVADAEGGAAMEAALRSAYDGFRRSAAAVSYRFLPVGEEGAGIITGDALQRAPGIGGRTAAFCLDAPDVVPEQQLLDQAPLWSLALREGRVVVRAGQLSVSAPAPPTRPLPLVVDSLVDPAFAFPGAGRARLRLFSGDRLLAAATSEEPRLPLDVYHRPAYLGVDRDGRRPLRGQLARPLLFNDDLASLAGPRGDDAMAAQLSAAACRQLVSPEAKP